MNHIGIRDLIRSMKPGEMTYLSVQRRPDEPWETGFIIRDDREALLPSISTPATFVLQGGVFKVGRVYPIVLMIQTVERVCETWVNLCDPDGLQCLENLAHQEDFGLQFFTPQPAGARVIRNSFRPWAKQVIQMSAGWETWTSQEFDQAREVLFHRYPDPETLWERLLQANPKGNVGIPALILPE